MSEADHHRWEEKHGRAATSPLGAPESTTAWIPVTPGHAVALDLAAGRGRNCGILLSRGYEVVAVDISSSALRALRQSYTGASHRVATVQADLDRWPFAPEAFDLVLQCDFLDRRLFGAMKASVRPGGHVLIDTFAAADRGAPGPRNDEYRLRPGELRAAFSDWEVLQFERRSIPTTREAILARKPAR